LCERRDPSLAKPLSKAIDIIFIEPLNYYAANKGEDDTIVDHSTFFRNKRGRHIEFEQFWRTAASGAEKFDAAWAKVLAVFTENGDAPHSRKRAAAPSGSQASENVTLKEVVDAGLLKAPLKLTRHYKKTGLVAELLPDGKVRFQGKSYESCSTAADFARSTVTGRQMSTNGWIFWKYKDDSGNLQLLDVARQEFLSRKGK
jgi:hypothetical protein